MSRTMSRLSDVENHIKTGFAEVERLNVKLLQLDGATGNWDDKDVSFEVVAFPPRAGPGPIFVFGAPGGESPILVVQHRALRDVHTSRVTYESRSQSGSVKSTTPFPRRSPEYLNSAAVSCLLSLLSLCVPH